MKGLATVVLACSVSFVASAATPEQVQFVGSVQHDGMTPVSFDLQLPSKQDATLKFDDGYPLEFSTPGNAATPDGARIRLLSPAGDVLHVATVPDPGMASKSFAYRICEGQVTFISPAPAAIPACGA